ncbi:MAG: PEP-CTERM sorting domain-containing protein [Phycisphaerales bacterium]|nr:PEP-CTERM sorting domain-containing protein [Phycisphaerales bacterium]
MKKFGLILAIAAIAGAAQAKDSNISNLLEGKNTGVSGITSRSVQYATFNVAGTPSMESYGSALNTVWNTNIGAGSHVIGIGWDVNLTAVGASWLSELQVSFEDTALSTGVYLTPGVGDTFSGTGAYSSGGVLDLIGLALDFNVGGDGLLHMEFFEGYNDYVGSADGYWNSGTLTVMYDTIPAPGAMALFGAAGFVAARRRR